MGSDRKESALERATAMLARRALSRAELRDRLARGGFAETEIHGAIERLAKQRCLEDEELARRVVETSRRKGLGRRRVEAELRRRGLTPPAWDREDEERALEMALDRAFSRHGESPDGKTVRRVAARLARKGFDPHEVRRAMESRGLMDGFGDS